MTARQLKRIELRALGDSAWLFEAGGEDSRQLDQVLQLAGWFERERIPEVLDIVSSFASLAVYFDPADGEKVLAWLTSLTPPAAGDAAAAGRTVEIPVVYGDLAAAGAALGRTADEIVRLHSSAEYTVAAIGFSPGFPYLAGLPPELSLPRVSSPRPVEAGSVAIAGGQAGIYPCASQGGWHVLGKTTAELFQPDRDEPSLLRPGDKVRFVPVKEKDAKPAKKQRARLPTRGALEIIEPGPVTSVQDLGRAGFRHFGVALGGAADPVSAMVANRLVGNPDGAAVLECCLRGPLLKFHERSRLAYVGWADPRSGSVIEVGTGGQIDLRGPMRSVRGYVAIAGGIEAPLVMGSRATDLRSGFGGFQGRILQAGDRLGIGQPGDGPKPGKWRVGWPDAVPGRMIELRFLPGMQADWFSPEAKQAFCETLFEVSARSDRMGARLDGAVLALSQPRELVSQPVIPGSVQVPPDGQPIVLMPECQTIGGYPQIGHVISADLPKLARAWPGTQVSFREISLDEARLAWREQKRDADMLQTGLSFKL